MKFTRTSHESIFKLHIYSKKTKHKHKQWKFHSDIAWVHVYTSHLERTKTKKISKKTRQNKTKKTKNMRIKIKSDSRDLTNFKLKGTHASTLKQEPKIVMHASIHYCCPMQSFSRSQSFPSPFHDWSSHAMALTAMKRTLSCNWPFSHGSRQEKDNHAAKSCFRIAAALPCRGVLRKFVKSWPPSWKAEAWKDAWNVVK